MVSHIGMKNDKSDMIDKIILKHLNHNEISLYSDTVQMTIFCFQRLSVETDETLTVNLTESIDEILL